MSDFGIDIKIGSSSAKKEIDSVVTKLDTAKAKAASMGAVGTGSMSSVAGAARSLNAEMVGVGKAITAAAAGFVALKALGALADIADASALLSNKLRPLISDEEKLEETSERLYEMSQDLRVGWGDTVSIFARVTLATKDLGRTQEEAMNFTRQLSMAVKLSGASASEASAGMAQLSQGLASGTLRGDELRSVLEQLPAVADVIAKSLGVTRGELRRMGEDGKITASTIIQAFNEADKDLAARFGTTVPTIAERMQALKDSFVRFVGVLADTGIFTVVTEALKGLADVLGLVTSAMKVAGDVWNAGKELWNGLLDIIPDLTAETYDLAEGDFAAAEATRELDESNKRLAESLKERASAMEVATRVLGLDKLAKAKSDLATINSLLSKGRATRTEQIEGFGSYEIGPDISIEEIAGTGVDAIARLKQAKRELEKSIADIVRGGVPKGGKSAAEIQADALAHSYQTLDADAKVYGLTLDAEIKALEDQAKARDDANAKLVEEENAKRIAIRSMVDAADQTTVYKNAVSELTAALERGWITEAEFAKHVGIAEKALADANAQAEEAARIAGMSSFEKVVDQVWNVADAKASAITSLMSGLEDQFVNLITSFKFDFKGLVDQLMADLARVAFRQAAGGFVKLLGLAEGGDFTVGGSGGTDSQLVAFRASPNERVTVTPQHDSGGRIEQSSSGPATVKVVNVYDKSMMVEALNSNDGERAILNVLRKNPQLVRSLRAS